MVALPLDVKPRTAGSVPFTCGPIFCRQQHLGVEGGQFEAFLGGLGIEFPPLRKRKAIGVCRQDVIGE